MRPQPPLLRRAGAAAAFLVGVLLAGGCGSHAAPSASKTTSAQATPQVILDKAPADIDLAIDEFSANPPGPTTASTITIHFVLANHGCDCTPYGSANDGTLSYTPIQWDLYRDGVVVASGSIYGLTGLDRVSRDIVLKDQGAPDRHYQLVIDPDGRIPERVDHDLQCLLSVPFGGSG